MSSKFSRNASRVQPTPKICISKRAHNTWPSQLPTINLSIIVSVPEFGAIPAIGAFGQAQAWATSFDPPKTIGIIAAPNCELTTTVRLPTDGSPGQVTIEYRRIAPDQGHWAFPIPGITSPSYYDSLLIFAQEQSAQAWLCQCRIIAVGQPLGG